MGSNSIFISAVHPRLVEQLTTVLQQQGYEIIGESSGGNETIRRCRQSPPDILIITQRLQEMSGLAVAEILQEITQCVVLLDADCVGRSTRSDGLIYLSMPLAPGILINTVNVLSQTAYRFHSLTSRISSLESNIKQQRTITRAKDIIRQTYDMTEDEAHAFLRKVAMNRRTKLVEAAELIISEME